MLNICNTNKEVFSNAEQKKPIPGDKRFKIKMLGYVGERYNNFPNYGRGGRDQFDYYNDPKLLEKFYECQSFSFQEVSDLVSKLNLNPKDVHITASFNDDYLNIEVIHISDLSYEQQLEEYNSLIEEDNKRRLEMVSRQIKDLQNQEKLLKKKVK
jgi:hypothetical protein